MPPEAGAFCVRHSRWYSADGCPACRNEERWQAQRSGAPKKAIAWGGVLLLAALAIWLAPARRRYTPRLDPSPYRQEIEAIERIVYPSEPFDADTYPAAYDQMIDGMTRLAGDLRPFIPNGSPGEELEQFLVTTSIQAQRSFDTKATREGWEPLRERYFLPAPWFRTLVAPARVAVPADKTVPDDIPQYQQEIDNLRHVASQLEPLVQSSDSWTLEHGDERWTEITKEALDELTTIREHRPPALPKATPPWKAVLEALREVEGDVELLRHDPRREWIDRERSSLKRAQELLDAARGKGQ